MPNALAHNEWRFRFLLSDDPRYAAGNSLTIFGRILCAQNLFIDIAESLDIGERNRGRDTPQSVSRWRRCEGHPDERHRTSLITEP